MQKHASKDVSDEDIVVKTTPEGDKYVELGKKKRATVRTYKGVALCPFNLSACLTMARDDNGRHTRVLRRHGP